MAKQIVIIESLTVPVLCCDLLPMLCGPAVKNQVFYYIEATPSAKSLAGIISKAFNVTIAYLEFGFFDIKDENGFLVRLKIPFEEAGRLQEKIINDPVFKQVLKDPLSAQGGLGHFLKKRFLRFNFVLDTDSLMRVIALTHIALWKKKQDPAHKDSDVLLCIRPRVWTKYLNDYANDHGVKLKATLKKMPSLKELLIECIGRFQLRFFLYALARLGKANPPLPLEGNKVMVDFMGHLNWKDRRMHSDVFFWQDDTIKGSDILINFSLARDPLDEDKWQLLASNGIKAVCLNTASAHAAKAPVWNYWPSQPLPCLATSSLASAGALEKNWFKRETKEYYEQFYYWREYFKRTGTKIYTTWYKYDAQHMLMAHAIREAGGIFTIYQRAFEEIPSPETTLWSDIAFGFSKDGIDFERQCFSEIPYYVVTGYIGDYRFQALKPTAMEVRKKLQQHGASRIVAYFDENSNDNARWHTGHKPMRENYAFLLEKVLNDPQLGLVIKPKTPRTLRRRLAEVNDLLSKAEATGRCFIFEEGRIQGSFPPATAALAADFAIHGHLDSATAGFEAALAGIPTLLLDKEGCPISKLYRLGPQVAFTNWEDLWKACQEHWRRPEGLPGFGDWSSMINDMDPFRDGRGAYRIGMYFKWLLEGYQQNWSREQILAEAAARYRKAWGQDKVVAINC